MEGSHIGFTPYWAGLPAVLAAAVLAGPGRADAQVRERTSAHLRNDCRLAAQILTLEQPDPLRAWALQRIAACDETGGPALAALWTAPPERELERLYWSSAGLLDARLLAAVRTTATATSNPTAVRLAALRVLTAYVDPRLDPGIQDLTPPGGEQFAQPIGSVDHRVQSAGEPPTAGYQASILTLLAELAASDPDATVRYAAGRLRDSVELRGDCRLAEQVLTTGQPATHREEALKVIGLCGRAAAPAIIAAWTSADLNRTELGLLRTSTRVFITPELVEALFSTLTAPGRQLDVRIASLLVLITYADSSVVPGFRDFIGDSTELLIRWYGGVDHPFLVVGRETVGPLTGRLRAALQTIAASDPDAAMRLAARVALRNPPLR